MDTLLNKVVKEHERLLNGGKTPDSLFLSKASHYHLTQEATVSYHLQEGNLLKEFLGMKIYEVQQYRNDTFKIYCKPEFLGEL